MQVPLPVSVLAGQRVQTRMLDHRAACTVGGVGSPRASSLDVSRRMSRQRTADTNPEIRLRMQLHGMGLRYRINRRPISGLRRSADIVFGPARVAVMVDGCFWHSCPIHRTSPKANAAWWRDKLRRNEIRDRETDLRFAEEGWQVVRVWEHEDPVVAARRIQKIVNRRRTQLTGSRARRAGGEAAGRGKGGLKK
jgi:DNA mismatch endonuclease (patch repair protein)